MSSASTARIFLYVDPSAAASTLPPGHGEPGFERAFAEARMFVNVAYAGCSRRVLIRLARTLPPPSRAIARWMSAELKAGRLLAVSAPQSDASHRQLP